jgi:hypothetical protein
MSDLQTWHTGLLHALDVLSELPARLAVAVRRSDCGCWPRSSATRTACWPSSPRPSPPWRTGTWRGRGQEWAARGAGAEYVPPRGCMTPPETGRPG